jgi:hypothetical protein
MGINDIGWLGCVLAPNEPAPSADDIIGGTAAARRHFHFDRLAEAVVSTPAGRIKIRRSGRTQPIIIQSM